MLQDGDRWLTVLGDRWLTVPGDKWLKVLALPPEGPYAGDHFGVAGITGKQLELIDPAS